MDNDVTQLEQQSWNALRHNYPILLQLDGCISFISESDSPILTDTAYYLSEADNLMLKQPGVRSLWRVDSLQVRVQVL